MMTTFTFDHVGLSVADLDAQRRFYTRALGLVERWQGAIPQAEVRIAVLSGPTGLQIELIERLGSTPQNFTDVYDAAGTQGYFHLALRVIDLDATFAEVLSSGATAVSAPAPALQPGLRFAYVKDPEGNLIELIQRAE